MSSPVWRFVAFLAVLGAIVYVCLQGHIGDPATYGDGIGGNALTSAPFRIGPVAPGTSLARAGLHTGELVRWKSWNLQTRAAVAAPVPGSKATLETSAGRSVTLVALPAPHEGLSATLTALRLAFLIVAAFLVARRWDERAVRALALFLGGFGLALALSASAPILSSYASFAVFVFGSVALLIVAVAAAADFSAHVTGTPRPVENVLWRLTVATAIFAVVLLGYVALLLRPGIDAIIRGPLALVGFLPFVLAIATIVAGYVEARGADRVRKRWVLWIIGLGLLGPAIDIIVSSVAGYNATVDQSSLITVAIIPVGLAYVILRHRLIDVGFVLNQAAVFTGVSIVVVGIVVLVEYLLSRYVESVSHVTSTAVQIVVALALGFSINAIHKRVDRVVDQLFFRKRHEAEAALRAFALDAAYVTEPGVLLARTVDMVELHTQAIGAGIWMRDTVTGAFTRTAGALPAAIVDVNDPAVVAMRARHVVVDLHSASSALPGALAFPMTAGGEFLGTLLCAAKRDEESYAPDERAALERVADAVAHAWAALRTKELEREVERLRSTLRPTGATEGAIGTF